MDDKEKEMRKRCEDVLEEATVNGITVTLVLSPTELLMLHGLMALAMKHPRVKEELKYAYNTGEIMREKIKRLFVELGFTREEAEYLDQKEVTV